MEEIAKPPELLAARASAEELFALLRSWFGVPQQVTIDLQAVDSAVAELGNPQMAMAMAMRKLQALHLIATPGVRTTTDVVLTVIQDLERALLEAPKLHLRQWSEQTDWDAALAALEAEGAAEGVGDDLGPDAAPEDDELTAFRRHHRALRVAARAVLHLSDGESRILA